MTSTDIHIPSNLILYLGIMIGFLIVVKLLTSLKTPKKRRGRKHPSHSKKFVVNNRLSSSVRSDETILRTPISRLTWAEFERLFALYFRSQGYEVEETGIGGSDGGVDLVLIDRRTKERTAVQLKHWKDSRKVGPNIIRELHSARFNTKPTCLYAMLITSSDVTQQGRKEAEDRRITYWHGGVLEMKLSKWTRWQAGSQKVRKND